MAWENQITGYKVAIFNDIEGKPTIPIDAIFLSITKEKYHTYGTKFHGEAPLDCYAYHYHLPIYKKSKD